MQQHYMQDLAQISLPVNQTMQPSSASTVAEHPFNVPSSSSHSVQEASMQREAQESIQAPSNMISLPSLNMPIASFSHLAPQPQFMIQSFASNICRKMWSLMWSLSG